MKRFYFILFALLAYVGMVNAAETVSKGGTVKAGTVYSVPLSDEAGYVADNTVVMETAAASGQYIVVFLNAPSATNATLDFKNIFYNAAGNKNYTPSGNIIMSQDGSFSYRRYYYAGPQDKIEVYAEDMNGEIYDNGYTWCYVIVNSLDEVSTVANPADASTGGGGADKPTPVTIGNSASVKPNTVYNLPLKGEDGYVSDNDVVMETPSTSSQYIVVFLNKADVATAKTDFKNIFYGGPTRETSYQVATNFETSQDGTFSYLRYYRNAAETKIDVYAQDMTPTTYGTGWTWSYVIVNSLDEVSTVANPYDVGGPAPVVDLDGQTEEKAFTLTQTPTSITSPKSKTSTTEYVIYAKFEAAADGTATVTMPDGETWGKYLKKPGDTRFNTFNFDNSFEVVQGQTYYIYYRYKSEVTGEAKYALREAGAGESRGAAILLEATGGYNLLGVPPVDVEGGKNYTNTTTWFKIAKDGALKANNLVSVTIGGDNTTEVALYQNDEATPIKTYAMGDGSGMLAKNSTVKLDIDLTQNDYYLGITQDDVNGTANFTFKVADEGETIAHAFTAEAGSNTVTTAGWYKYTHAGDRKLIKVSGISKIVNEEGGLVAEGDDVKVGFVITEGTSIYFEASGNFTITLSDVEKGMTADDPVIIDNENGATFNLSGAATDTQRFMQYSATEDGIFIYATQNASVLESAVSATVRDVTNAETPKTVSIVQEESAEFGETYFIYKWPVVAGHAYLIEQSLGNNFGKVEFFTMFTAAEAGETIGKAFPIELYEAKDLGRQATTPKYYKFTAAEAGDYTLSVQLTGYVKSYDADGNATTIQKSYSDGLVYHNETFTLAEGESLVFSCQPSETIEHVAGGVNDAFIPNYYATVTTAENTGGLDYNHPETITENDEMSLDASNVWYGPITVPAETPLYVKATLNDETETSAVYFAVQTATSGLQWINKDTKLSVEIEGKTQIFTLAPSTEERQINLLGYGMLCAGTFSYSFTEPTVTPETKTLTVTPKITYDSDTKSLTIEVTLPELYDESETPVENLNMWAVSITNTTTNTELQLTNGGDGTYNATEKLTAINTIDEASFFNADDTYLIKFGTPATSGVTITAVPVSLDVTTDIKNIDIQNSNAVKYNIAGQRVNNANSIYIINGVKVMVK